MNIVVCVKQIPNPELQFRVREDEKDIQREALTYQVNGPDEYALEEAVRIRERHGGKVTAVSAGPERVNEVLRQAMAKGADEAYRVDLPDGLEVDPSVVSRVLAKAIEGLGCDLILTGVQSEDFAHASTGPLLASFLDIAHASVVAKVELEDGRAKVYRELEGGLQQVLSLDLPALLTIQFGINEPRYASVAAILKATRQPIHELRLEDLGLSPEDLGSGISVRRMYIPEETHKAEMIEGSPEDVARRLITVLREKGFAREV
ncbi:MAG: electron transfer flavoprotein subunit beta/FixA family protein [Thermoplasmata archaeon]